MEKFQDPASAVTALDEVPVQLEEVFTFPASFAQQRLWFLDKLQPGSFAYNIPIAVRLSGALDIAVLSKTLNEILRRHESLRTTFMFSHDRTLQVIALELRLPLPLVDLSAVDADE